MCVARSHFHAGMVLGWGGLVACDDEDAGRLTSAAAAAADLGSFTALLSPSVRAGPPTVLFGALATLLGTDALVAGAGAAPRVRPWPSKLSFDCLPQRLPIGGFAGVEMGWRREGDVGRGRVGHGRCG
jgi:hypothetical protein